MNLSIVKIGNYLSNYSQRKDSAKGRLTPGYHDTIQMIEVEKESSNTKKDFDYKQLDGSYICLKHVRPELFIRRDFINDFVLKGKVYLVQDNNLSKTTNSDDNYYIIINNNVLCIILSGHLYRRFGLIGQKICKDKKSDIYEVKIDLKDERIIRSNKYQDKLVSTLRRLEPINKVFLRWTLHNSDNNLGETENLILEYFNNVIEEYRLDGFKPIPLDSCFKIEQKLERTWINRSQLHPPLSLNVLSKQIFQLRDNSEKTKVTDIVDWLGYQLLSIDCNQEEICCNYNSLIDNGTCEPYNVYCSQISGIYDCDLIETTLSKVLERGRQEKNDSAIFRALFLYNRNLNDINNDQVTILLQDYSISSPNDIYLLIF